MNKVKGIATTFAAAAAVAYVSQAIVGGALWDRGALKKDLGLKDDEVGNPAIIAVLPSLSIATLYTVARIHYRGAGSK